MADNERPLFEGIDEIERTYAPGELAPGDPRRTRVELDEAAHEMPSYEVEDAPSPAPVASAGNAPSASMAPPNTGHVDRGGGPGDPKTQAGDPMDDHAVIDRS